LLADCCSAGFPCVCRPWVFRPCKVVRLVGCEGRMGCCVNGFGCRFEWVLMGIENWFILPCYEPIEV